MMVEVMQEDREAAAIIYQRFRDYDYAGWILDGTNAMGDPDSVIQAFARHRIAAEQRGKLEGARLAIEAAGAYVDGKGGTVIPGATVFAALVSGNFQPCMSGDARDRLHPHSRRRFDDATNTLAAAIRALDPAKIVGEGDSNGTRLDESPRHHSWP